MILEDTGPAVATLVRSDPAHRLVTDWIRANREPFHLAAPAIGEVGHFLARDGTVDAEGVLMTQIASGRIVVADAVQTDYGRARDLLVQYRDLRLGIVDALIVAMAERLRVTTILTLDHRHFGAVRPAHCERFALVP